MDEKMSINQTRILTFDSLGSDHKAVVKTLGKYLQLEAKDKKDLDKSPEVIGYEVFVPQQPNSYDCGVYLLHFVKRFMLSPEKFIHLTLVKVPDSYMASCSYPSYPTV